MRKLIAIGAGAVGVAGMTMTLLSQGVAAAAPDVAGQTYGKAQETLSQEGLTPVVKTRVGDRVADDDCIVDRVQDANFTDGTGTPASGMVWVYLNCYGSTASQSTPGYSSQNPMGKLAQEAAEEAAANG